MDAFEIADVELRRRAHGVLYQEFLRQPSLRARPRKAESSRWTLARAAE